VREIIKSMISFSLAVPLLGVKQITSLLSHKDPGKAGRDVASTLDAVTQTAQQRMGGRIEGLYRGGDIVQRSVVDLIARSVGVGGASQAADGSQERTVSDAEFSAGRLDVSTFVTLGGAVSAGMGDFGLSAEFQTTSFPAHLAQQMRTAFNQPLIEPPAIGDVAGFPRLPVRIPAIMQTTTLMDYPPTGAVHNLSIPGLCVTEARTLAPIEPLVHRNDAKQTLANLILGMPDMMHKPDKPLLTPLDYVLTWKPSFAVVSLGYDEIVEAAVQQEASLLPVLETFLSEYDHILSSLRGGGCEVLVTTLPYPGDTALFSPIDSAAKVLKIQPDALMEAFNLRAGDRVTVTGLMDIGGQLIAGEIAALDQKTTASLEWMERVETHVESLNRELIDLANRHGAVVYDMNGFFSRLRQTGISMGTRRFTADFLGGFYELNGYCPGPTGQALIANEILGLLNRTYGARFPLVDTGVILTSDPVADYRIAEGPTLAGVNLPRRVTVEQHEAAPTPVAPASEQQTEDTPAAAPGLPLEPFKPTLPLRLPSTRLQVLPLNHETSYYGDALRTVHCRTPEEAKWGSGRELLFGGLAMLNSHLRGNLLIRFSEPVNQITHFEASLQEGLTGDDGMLTAPQFYRLPGCHNSVKDDPNLVSSGDLNLDTGEVTSLAFHFRFMNTALLSLVRANPKFPDVPISFPGLYGSAWARFEQRADGNLDFSFFGTTFVPLGMVLTDPIRFPLPFCSPTLEFATIPAAGTQLHPHIHLSTKPPEEAEGIIPPDLPTNTILEFTPHSHHTSYGDEFGLNAEEFGGGATGRSQLTGRVEIQFGERFGNSVSVAVASFAPGGLLYAPNPPPSTLTETFPGRLYGGFQGHNETLRFPKLQYQIKNPYCLDDPFELCVGAVDLKTGRLLHEMLHRGLVGQNIFMALLEVEPRTPRASFEWRGPALFERDARGQLIFRFRGACRLLYPEGYLFPAPDLKNGFAIGPDSALDPFYWIQAMHHTDETDFVKKGGRENVDASNGERFSFKYEIPGQLGRPGMFEYENHTLEARYVMHRLNWVSFINSRTSNVKPGNYDTVSFTGYGTWSLDTEPISRLATVQVSTSKESPYVSILIDSGYVSNVNTKPATLDDVLP